MSTQFYQVAPRARSEIQGMNVSKVSDTSIQISTGHFMTTDYKIDLSLDTALIVHTNTRGVNGLDTGTIQASTFDGGGVLTSGKLYEVYVIYSMSAGKVAAGILHLHDGNPPVMPEGYDVYRLVGWFMTDASANVPIMYQNGDDVWIDDPVKVADGTHPALIGQQLALGGVVPANASLVHLMCVCGDAITVAEMQLRPYGGTGGANGIVWLYADITGGTHASQVTMPITANAGIPTIIYQMGAATSMGTIFVNGYNCRR